MVADQHRQRATQSAATLPSDVMVPPREKCARLAFGAREPSKRFVLFLRGEGTSSLAPTDAKLPDLGSHASPIRQRFGVGVRQA